MHLLRALVAVAVAAEHLAVFRNCAPAVFPRLYVVGLHFLDCEMLSVESLGRLEMEIRKARASFTGK